MFNPVVSTNSMKQNLNQVNALGKQVQDMRRVLVFKGDDGVRNVILDKDGLRTTGPGVDVVIATPGQLTFNSNNKVFKIIADSSVTLTKAAGDNTAVVSIPHGYADPPMVTAFGQQSGGTSFIPLPEIVANITTGVIAKQTGLYVDATNIVFYITTPAWAGNTFQTNALTYTFFYYVLQETAQ